MCTKENRISDYLVIDIKEAIKLRKMALSADSAIFVCGGNRECSGAIFRSVDKGQNFTKVYSDNEHSINDIMFLRDGSGFACGDDLSFYRSTDNGTTWFKGWDFTFSNWQDFITPLQSIYFANKDTGFIAGGADFSTGVICKTFNGGGNWAFESSDNEQKGIFFTNPLQGFFCGYGIIQKTIDSGKKMKALDITGDYFTSLFFSGNETGFSCGYNGGIYKTANAGEKWSSVYSQDKFLKKRIHLNNIYFTCEKTGFAVGNDGIILRTDDYGDSWKEILVDENMDLISIFCIDSKELLITCDKGKIIMLKI